MKTKIKLLLLILLLPVLMTAQTDAGFNYKALITYEGAPVSNKKEVRLKFTIQDIYSSLVYQETQEVIPDENGIVSVYIGEGDVIEGAFKKIDWDQELFLNVQVDIGGGYFDYGTTAFKYVPYAKYADKAGNLKFVDGSGDSRDAVFTGGKVGIGINSPVGKLNIIPIGNLYDGESNPPKVSNAGLLIGEETDGLAIDGNQIETIGTDFHINYCSNRKVTIAYGGGNVGIGTKAPEEKLQIGDMTGSPGMKLLAANNGKSKIKLFEGTGYGFEFEYNGTDDVLNLWSRKYTGNEAVRTTWKKNGDVEINGKLTTETGGRADMKAYIYGSVDELGNIIANASSAGFTVTYVDLGTFYIEFNNTSIKKDQYIVVATLNNDKIVDGIANIIMVTKGDGGFNVGTYVSLVPPLLGNSKFDFVVYKK